MRLTFAYVQVVSSALGALYFYSRDERHNPEVCVGGESNLIHYLNQIATLPDVYLGPSVDFIQIVLVAYLLPRKGRFRVAKFNVLAQEQSRWHQ